MEISDLVSKVDMVEYIEQYTDLVLRSDGEYWGLSPLKEEKTPSFSVNPEKQTFYDFSTGLGGDILEFIQKVENISFLQALDKLKQWANITEDISTDLCLSPSIVSVARKFKPIKSNRPEPNPTILPDDYMEIFERNENVLKVWEDEGISREVMEGFQVRFDPISNRLVFPVRDEFGRIVNVCGRTLDKNFKEKGLRKYTYFQKWGGSLGVIYGISENAESIARNKEVILFEGAKSVMLASTWGIKNTGAILTSHLNPNQFLMLVKMQNRVVFALDKDVYIENDKNIRKLLKYVSVEVIRDRDDLLDPKMAPVDAGKEVWDYLYRNRTKIN